MIPLPTATVLRSLRDQADYLESDHDLNGSAANLRRLAQEIEARDQETNERLAIAGEIAAAAERVAANLKQNLDDAHFDAQYFAEQVVIRDAENDELKVLLDRADTAAAEAVTQLERERAQNDFTRRIVAQLLDSFESDDEDRPAVIFRLGENIPEGISVEDAADIALALNLDAEGSDDEPT